MVERREDRPGTELSDFETIDRTLRDLGEIAGEWERISVDERLAWSLDWSNEMAKLEQLARRAVAGSLGGTEIEQLRDLILSVQEALPTIERLGLRRPSPPSDPEDSGSPDPSASPDPPTPPGSAPGGFDVFALRERVVGEYREYFESFVNILDERIERFVRQKLDQEELWPGAVLQLNPAYEPGATIGKLAERGVIRQETARFFGPSLRLHRHQEQALEIARRGEPYVVTTGTGSGKSLTYLVPIFDHIIRDDPSRHTVRAIVVYPMNALTNSQLIALERFRDTNWPDCPVTFKKYTGDVRGPDRQAILDDPPHILLPTT